jgi:hypothetical protein
MSSPPGVIAARRRGSHTEARSDGDRASRVFAQSAFTVAFPIKGDKSSVACWWEGERHTKLRSDLRLALGRVQAPLAGDAFELMRAAILEGEPGAGDEILDRA